MYAQAFQPFSSRGAR